MTKWVMKTFPGCFPLKALGLGYKMLVIYHSVSVTHPLYLCVSRISHSLGKLVCPGTENSRLDFGRGLPKLGVLHLMYDDRSRGLSEITADVRAMMMYIVSSSVEMWKFWRRLNDLWGQGTRGTFKFCLVGWIVLKRLSGLSWFLERTVLGQGSVCNFMQNSGLSVIVFVTYDFRQLYDC